MENNQIDLLILNDNENNPKIPLIIGMTSLSLLLLAVFFEFTIFYALGLITFAIAFVLSIVGVIAVSKFKKNHNNLTQDQLKKLKLSKWLSIITLILSSLIILGTISLIILIGNQGFGR